MRTHDEIYKSYMAEGELQNLKGRIRELRARCRNRMWLHRANGTYAGDCIAEAYERIANELDLILDGEV